MLVAELLVGRVRAVHGDLGRQAGRGDLVQHHRRFPSLSVGVTYLPIPLGGAASCCSSIERLVIGAAARGRRRPHAHAADRTELARSAAMDIFVLLDDDVRLLRHRRADRLFAGARRDRRRVLDRHPARSGDAEDLRRGQQGRDADHPVLRAGRRHHGGGRHGAAPGRLRRRAGRLHPRARRAVGRQRAGDDVPVAASPARRSPTPRRSAR